jgi:hypothetical protein
MTVRTTSHMIQLKATLYRLDPGEWAWADTTEGSWKYNYHTNLYELQDRQNEEQHAPLIRTVKRG